MAVDVDDLEDLLMTGIRIAGTYVYSLWLHHWIRMRARGGLALRLPSSRGLARVPNTLATMPVDVLQMCNRLRCSALPSGLVIPRLQ